MTPNELGMGFVDQVEVVGFKKVIDKIKRYSDLGYFVDVSTLAETDKQSGGRPIGHGIKVSYLLQIWKFADD
jgi:hypothetical protein